MCKYSLKRQLWTISTYGIRLMRNLIVSDFQLRDGKQHNLAPLTGSPNDGVLLNALKTLFRLSSALSNLQKCILSGAIKVVSVRSSQGNLNLFEITYGLSMIFPKILDAILGFTKVRIFLIPLSIAFSNPRFPFSTKNRLSWGLKCEKLNFRKPQGINQISYQNCT